MANHGVFVTEKATDIGTPIVAESGVPYVVGAAPVWMAEHPAAANTPVVCHNWAEAVDHFGYSDDWATYPLCEAMYVHFRLYSASPIILCNVLSTANPTAVASAEKTVTKHKITLPLNALNDANLVVTTAAENGSTLVKGTDYAAYHDGENLVVELLSGSTYYSSTSLYVAYKTVSTEVNSTAISGGIEAVEKCATTIGVIPDLLLAPGWSHQTAIAALMATKAASINGLFTAKALIDLNCGDGGAATASAAVTAKNSAAMNDPNMIVCWPMVKAGDKVFHMSLHIAGVMANLDTENGGVPFESPSNKSIAVDGLCSADGTEITLTLAEANSLGSNGIVTALNFMRGWTVWGNYTAAYPSSTDVKDYFIPVSRMFHWVGNSVVQSFWTHLDMPMNRRLVDTVLDTANIWLGSLVGSGYLLGARIEMLESENTMENLMNGIIKLHIYLAPPAPAQEIDFSLEYDASYVRAAVEL